MGHNDPWWIQLHRCKQLALEGVKNSWTVQWYTTLPHSVWNSSPLAGVGGKGGTWIFPPDPEHSVQLISFTTLTGLLHPWQNKPTTIKQWNFNIRPWCGIQWMVTIYLSTFMPSLAFPYFFLSPSTSHSLLNKNLYYWLQHMVLFAPHFEQMHLSNNFNIWIIILLF